MGAGWLADCLPDPEFASLSLLHCSLGPFLWHTFQSHLYAQSSGQLPSQIYFTRLREVVAPTKSHNLDLVAESGSVWLHTHMFAQWGKLPSVRVRDVGEIGRSPQCRTLSSAAPGTLLYPTTLKVRFLGGRSPQPQMLPGWWGDGSGRCSPTSQAVRTVMQPSSILSDGAVWAGSFGDRVSFKSRE